jgi:hypothetical protein
MGTRDTSESFLKAAMAREREVRRRWREKRRVLEDDEKDNVWRGKGRRGGEKQQQ